MRLFRTHRDPAARRRQRLTRRPRRFEALQPRTLMAADFGFGGGLIGIADPSPAPVGPSLRPDPIVQPPDQIGSLDPSPGLPTGDDIYKPGPIPTPPPELLPQIPELNSNPGAPATLYLDFDGHHQDKWKLKRNINTPAFDMDGNPSETTNAEKQVIEDVFERVAEDFAPFNLNVTTVEPDNQAAFDTNKAMRIVIGGNGDWSDGGDDSEGGVTLFSAFSKKARPNVGWVHAEDYLHPHRSDTDLANLLADTASHEAGHAFGLWHQSTFHDSFPVDDLVEEYRSGGHSTGPLMGDPNDANIHARSVWSKGSAHQQTPWPFDKIHIQQDDMAVIASDKNGFGYRPDLHGDDFASAAPTSLTSGVETNGIIERMSDVDMFSFTIAERSDVELNVNVHDVGPNLDPTLELWSQNGNLLERSDHFEGDEQSPSGETIERTLTPGTYYVAVSSSGDYGAVGQYALGGSVSEAPIDLGDYIPGPGGDDWLPGGGGDDAFDRIGDRDWKTNKTTHNTPAAPVNDDIVDPPIGGSLDSRLDGGVSNDQVFAADGDWSLSSGRDDRLGGNDAHDAVYSQLGGGLSLGGIGGGVMW